jgi:hypothetical protein
MHNHMLSDNKQRLMDMIALQQIQEIFYYKKVKNEEGKKRIAIKALQYIRVFNVSECIISGHMQYSKVPQDVT